MMKWKQILLQACLGALFIAPTACWFGDTGGGFIEWEKVEGPVATDLTAIFGFSETDIWAVGDGGAIIRYDGQTWKAVESNTSATLLDVWGSAPDDVWAVGGDDEFDGVVLHYDGNQWSEVVSHEGQRLVAVWGSEADSVFVLGGADWSTLLVHWDGHQWYNVDLPDGVNNGVDMWGDTEEDIYVATRGQVTHYNGTGWAVISDGFGATYPAASMWGSSAEDIYVAAFGGTIRHWDGANWTDTLKVTLDNEDEGYELNFHGLWGTSATNVIAVGEVVHTEQDAGPRERVVGTRIYRFDGDSWTRQDTGSFKCQLRDIWAASARHLWAVGKGGTILHYSP